jgi:hypothetical protein
MTPSWSIPELWKRNIKVYEVRSLDEGALIVLVAPSSFDWTQAAGFAQLSSEEGYSAGLQ